MFIIIYIVFVIFFSWLSFLLFSSLIGVKRTGVATAFSIARGWEIFLVVFFYCFLWFYSRFVLMIAR